MEPNIYNAKNSIDRALSVRDTVIEKFVKAADKDVAGYFLEVKSVIERMQVSRRNFSAFITVITVLKILYRKKVLSGYRATLAILVSLVQMKSNKINLTF